MKFNDLIKILYCIYCTVYIYIFYFKVSYTYISDIYIYYILLQLYIHIYKFDETIKPKKRNPSLEDLYLLDAKWPNAKHSIFIRLIDWFNLYCFDLSFFLIFGQRFLCLKNRFLINSFKKVNLADFFFKKSLPLNWLYRLTLALSCYHYFCYCALRRFYFIVKSSNLIFFNQYVVSWWPGHQGADCDVHL